MRKRHWYNIAIFLIFLTCSFIYLFFINSFQSSLERYARKIEKGLHKEEKLFEKIFTDDQLIHQIIRHYDPESNQNNEIKDEQIELLALRPSSLLIFKENELIYWSKNQSIPNQVQTNLLLSNPPPKLIQLNDGFFEVLHSKKIDAFGTYTLIGLIPVRKEFLVKSDYLTDHFLYVSNFPRNIKLSTALDGVTVRNFSHEPLFSITAEGSIRSPGQELILLLLFLATTITFLFLLNDLANHFSRRYSPGLGAIFLLIVAGGLRLAAYNTSFLDVFEHLTIISNIANITVLNGNLGDLFINGILLFWLVIFLHRELEIHPIFQFKPSLKFIATTAIYTIILTSTLILIGIFKSLVLESNLVFDFDNILDFNAYSVIAIISILLMMISLFLFSHKLKLAVQDSGQTFANKLLSLLVAILLSSPLIFLLDLRLPIWSIGLIALVFIPMQNLFMSNKVQGFTWFVLWVAIFSGLGSILLFKYNLDKDQEKRLAYAKELAEPKDKNITQNLFKLKEKLSQDDTLSNWLTRSKEALPVSPKDIRFHLDSLIQLYNDSIYNQFSYDVFALNEKQRFSPISNQTPEEILPLIEENSGFTPTDYEGIYAYLTGAANYAYNIHLDFYNKDNPRVKTNCYILLQPKPLKPAKIYSELLLISDGNSNQDYSDYKYEVINENRTINSTGSSNANLLEIAGRLDKGEWYNYVTSQGATLVYKALNGNIVSVSRELGGTSRLISLFSYFFVLIIFLLLILHWLNVTFHIFPHSISFGLFGKKSLRNRIQAAIVLLTIGSFVLVAIVTATFFRNTSLDFHENRLNRKIETVVNDLQYQIDYSAKLGIQNIDYKMLANAVSNIHKMDINIYGLNGKLIASSAMNIFEMGILSSFMNPKAYYNLRNYDLLKVLDEQLGTLHYKSAYLPIRDNQGNKVGYLNLPYYSRDSELRKDVFDLMGAMLNVYVFLFLLAGISAIFVGNSITKPISEIGEKLKYVQLGKNEPLQWTSRDEIGVLISQYNEMIHKLEENTEKLKVSEREGAWREMAKQIAHEIKNPLTPMKLSIQYLTRAYESNPDNIEPLLNRVSNTLIEQIDDLSRIASEFSNFANMPPAQNHLLNINELLTSIHNLYREHETGQLKISLNLPKKPIFTYGDKSYLMRVFNNLVKNAIQAIPEDRNGNIQIELEQIDNDTLVAKVKDNGTGIPENLAEKVFYPNFTTKNSGMGLGLAISKKIIENINGKIYFKTQNNIGTEFYVELPIYENELEANVI